jgi:hypothetical protein
VCFPLDEREAGKVGVVYFEFHFPGNSEYEGIYMTVSSFQ